MIPTLHTARLVLRPPLLADFPEHVRCLTSPRAALMGGPFDRKGAWGQFCHGIAGWTLFGHGALAITRRGEDRALGQVDISHGPLFPEKELGWVLYEGAEGQGLATEAAAALRDWAAAERSLTRLVSYIDPENARSIALALRLGAELDPTAAKQDPEDLVFRHRVLSGGAGEGLCPSPDPIPPGT